jgi:AbrB family looped-hinge helix DNA binding protein
MNKVKITSKGQITIPKDLREKLEIKEGMYLGADIEEGNLVLKPLPENIDKIKLINYAYSQSRDSVGLLKVREMAAGFNLNMSKQVRKIREEE